MSALANIRSGLVRHRPLSGMSSETSGARKAGSPGPCHKNCVPFVVPATA
jgi:hypothetical protein